MSDPYAYAEIMERSRGGPRIKVTWKTPCSREQFHANVEAIKTVAGRTFVGRDKTPEPYWHVPLDMDTCRMLRTAFGPLNPQMEKGLAIGPVLRRWATEEVGAERNLKRLAAADTATLQRLPAVLPVLAEAIHLGPRGINMTAAERLQALSEPASYQAADVAFLAGAKGPLNACHMGLGKTIELIASIYEAGMDDGANLIIAPIVALNTVWKKELERWQHHPVVVCCGTRGEREQSLEKARRLASLGEPFFLVVNPAMITLAKDEECVANVHVKKATKKQVDNEVAGVCFCSRLKDPHIHYGWRYEAFRDIHFRTVVLDEAHAAAIGNTNAITNVALNKLKADKRICMTGTPMGGKPIKLFGILQWLNPETFTSKWNWAERWLEITDNGYGKTIGKLRSDRKKDFYEHLAPYVLRRTKDEVAKWLPPKQYVNIWVDMEGDQKKQYEKWDADLELEIEENRLVGKSVLDIYTRLRQFAIAEQYIDAELMDDDMHVSLYPTENSCKLPALLQLLDELGVNDGEEGDEQVVIFSQYTRVVDMVSGWLKKQGISNAVITGKVTGAERDRLQERFQSGNLRVLVMNVKAGGVAITLDKANTVVFLDETWNPDDQEQAEDRCHRMSRIHQVTVYYIRTRGTIEERVFDEVTGKQMSNNQILDERRKQES